MNKKFAIITPSFNKDFERCKLLVESIKTFVKSDITHYIIVEKRDEELFKGLNEDFVKIIRKENILPKWIKQLPFNIKGRNIWVSLKGRLLRGWIIQQIIKLGIVNHIDEDILIYMDSDEFFVKRVDFERVFIKNNKLRLFKKQGRTELRWDNTISQLLKIDVNQCSGTNYVEHPVTWLKQNVINLQKHIEKNSGKNWIDTISRNWHFSEYQLYGNFITNILKENSKHYYDSSELSHKHEWTDGERPKFLTEDEIEKFFNDINDFHITAMISSAANIPAKKYEKHLHNLFVKETNNAK